MLGQRCWGKGTSASTTATQHDLVTGLIFKNLTVTAIGHPLEGMADFKHARKTVESMSHRGRDQFCSHLGSCRVTLPDIGRGSFVSGNVTRCRRRNFVSGNITRCREEEFRFG